MVGRLAPSFFLLGTPKSGTTFFYEDFARSEQIVEYLPGVGSPEWHSKEPWVFTQGFPVTAGAKQDWLSHYPECPQGKHLVAVDCTPGYFGSQEAPFGIHRAYGGDKHRLVFMVFLREPMSRSHSHYYQYEENGVFQGYFKECLPHQFQSPSDLQWRSGSTPAPCATALATASSRIPCMPTHSGATSRTSTRLRSTSCPSRRLSRGRS